MLVRLTDVAAALDPLLARIAGNAASPEHFLVPWSLILRESIGG